MCQQSGLLPRSDWWLLLLLGCGVPKKGLWGHSWHHKIQWDQMTHSLMLCWKLLPELRLCSTSTWQKNAVEETSRRTSLGQTKSALLWHPNLQKTPSLSGSELPWAVYPGAAAQTCRLVKSSPLPPSVCAILLCHTCTAKQGTSMSQSCSGVVIKLSWERAGPEFGLTLYKSGQGF